jgi:glucose/arabinose dehydrogenase
MAVAHGASTLTVRTDLGLAQRFARKLAAEQQMQTASGSAKGRFRYEETTVKKSIRAFATLIAAAGATAAIGLAAPGAHADTNDGKFLAALKSEGITDHVSAQHAIEAAHAVCQKLDAGETPTQVANDVLNSSTMPAYHAGYFVGASIKEYCPQYMAKVSGT